MVIGKQGKALQRRIKPPLILIPSELNSFIHSVDSFVSIDSPSELVFFFLSLLKESQRN